MWDLIEHLKDPALVARIQRRFGIKDREMHDKSKRGNEKIQQELGESSGGHILLNSNYIVEDNYIIENKFWYYLFLIGTNLGDEIFYASFIPFWFWNIDGAVGRRVVTVWTIIMYIGQGIKDILRWPRPGSPAKRLQKKWSEEYGMPSTHAMVAISLPFSVIIYTVNRYLYSISLGIICSLLWCAVICISRVYFGMHTVLDVIVGLVLASLLMLPIIPTVDQLDYFWLISVYSPLLLFVLSVAAIFFFPSSDHWTPTRGDTTMITSVCAGIHIGSWTNYNVGNMMPYPYPPPYKIIWPNYYMLGLGIVRTILGFALVLATRNLTKSFTMKSLSLLLHTTPEKVGVKNFRRKFHEIFIELATIYATYFLVGFNTVYSIPIIFRTLGIERPTFYTEI